MLKDAERGGRLPRRRVLSGTAGVVLASTAASLPTQALHAIEPNQPATGSATAAHLTHRNPDALAAPRGYTHVVSAVGARTVYVSGQVSLDRAGALVGKADLRAQAQQVFENIKVALTAAGASFTDVVKLTYYVLDASQVQVVREIRDAFVDASRPPASTLVEVRRLVREEFLIEVDAIASVRA